MYSKKCLSKKVLAIMVAAALLASLCATQFTVSAATIDSTTWHTANASCQNGKVVLSGARAAAYMQTKRTFSSTMNYSVEFDMSSSHAQPNLEVIASTDTTAYWNSLDMDLVINGNAREYSLRLGNAAQKPVSGGSDTANWANYVPLAAGYDIGTAPIRFKITVDNTSVAEKTVVGFYYWKDGDSEAVQNTPRSKWELARFQNDKIAFVTAYDKGTTVVEVDNVVIKNDTTVLVQDDFDEWFTEDFDDKALTSKYLTATSSGLTYEDGALILSGVSKNAYLQSAQKYNGVYMMQFDVMNPGQQCFLEFPDGTGNDFWTTLAFHFTNTAYSMTVTGTDTVYAPQKSKDTVLPSNSVKWNPDTPLNGTRYLRLRLIIDNSGAKTVIKLSYAPADAGDDALRIVRTTWELPLNMGARQFRFNEGQWGASGCQYYYLDNLIVTDQIPSEYYTVTPGENVEVSATYGRPGDTVTVTVTPPEGQVLKADGLTYTTAEGVTYPLYKRVGASIYTGSEHEETNASVYTFKIPESDVTVNAVCVSEETANLAVFGASYRAKTDTLRSGLQFGSRIYRSYGDYNLQSFGTILLRADMVEGKDLTDPMALIQADSTVGRVVECTKVMDRCTEYYDYAVRLVGITEGSYEAVEYIAIAYGIYSNGSGSETVYSEPLTRSYAQVVELVG